MYGVNSLARQLGIGEAFVSDTVHDTMKAFSIIESFPVVVAKRLFIQVPEQMERLDADICAFQTALEEAPEVFESVSVDAPVNVPLSMVNHLVRKVAPESPVGEQRIGIKRGFGGNVIPNVRLDGVLADIRNERGSDFAAALKDADNSGFVLRHVPSDIPSPLAQMHIPGLAADKGFIHFDFLFAAAQLHKRVGLHGEPDTVEHEPCGLLSDSERARDFIGANPVFAVGQQPHGNHPLVHPERRILEDSPDFDGELLLAPFAEPDSPRRDKRVRGVAASRARNNTIMPAEPHGIVKRLLRVAKKRNRFLQRPRELECLCHA